MSAHELPKKRDASFSSSGEASQRRERAAIAAQACETCRSRKTKCDEKRPKCGLCHRLNVECHYREPQPTKKDKSIQYMMDQLTRMENKLNAIGLAVSPTSTAFDTPTVTPPTASGRTPSISGHTPVESPPHSLGLESFSYNPQKLSRLPSDMSPSYQHLTAPHKVLLWPAVYEVIQQCGTSTLEVIKTLQQEGTPWLLQLELQKHRHTLPVDTVLVNHPVNPSVPFGGQSRVAFTDLNRDTMVKFMDSYFSTYNVLYPLLDKSNFESKVLPEVITTGFGYGDFSSVIALLVFALGKMGYDGVLGQPTEVRDGHPSGLRGGTALRPPGLEIFNEARKRLGFVFNHTSLENIQILQLTAVYYEACSRHLDFWRASVSASMAFQVLVKCEPIDWTSPRGYTIRKVYWVCNLLENWYHVDLDLPKTGIEDYEDMVPLPGEHTNDSELELVHMQFLAMITLRRLITRIHVTLFEAVRNAESSNDYAGTPMNVIKELTRQLDNWRELLPAGLQWDDNDRFGFPANSYTKDPGHQALLFSIDSTTSPLTESGSSFAMSTAQLRSRYYYARFMIYRPFVFRALHFPEQMTEEDTRHAATCLQACLLWPVSMEPVKRRKRLVPYLFAWTQNFLGVLLILRMTTEHRVLRTIAERYLDAAEVEQTVYLLLDWFRDMKQVDGIAEWAWGILTRLYGDVLDRQ